MSAPQTVYRFDESSRQGQVGEAVVVSALNSHPEWRVERAAPSAMEQRDLRIDYVARNGAHRGTLEVKADFKGFQTRNIPLELRHEHRFGETTQGWLYLSTATFVAILQADYEVRDAAQKAGSIGSAPWPDSLTGWRMLPKPGRLYIAFLSDLRDPVRLDRWRNKYPERGAPNGSYTTQNVCVPSRVLVSEGVIQAYYDVEICYSLERGLFCGRVVTLPQQRGLFG